MDAAITREQHQEKAVQSNRCIVRTRDQNGIVYINHVVRYQSYGRGLDEPRHGGAETLHGTGFDERHNAGISLLARTDAAMRL